MPFHNKLYLASGSPRRRELVGYLFNNKEVLPTSCVEPKWQKGQSPKLYLDECIGAKWDAAQLAYALNTKAQNGDFLLVADTIVVLGKEVLGKPTSTQDAFNALQKLSGKQHEVWTAFRLGTWEDEKFLLEDQQVVSKVSFRKLSKIEIQNYIKTKEPMDKAGSYGFQGVGIQNIKTVEGSYTNIVGLPLLELQKAAQRLNAK